MNEPNIDIVGMNAHAMAVQRYDDLCMALLTAIENNESRNDLLDLIGDSMNACDCVDDESIALWNRAKLRMASERR